MSSTSLSTRWLAGVAAVVVVAVALSVVAIVAGGDEQEFAAGTPEATVQSYLRAVIDRDVSAAAGHLAADLVGRCDEQRLRDAYRRPSDRDVRVTLIGTTEVGEVTEVRTRITEVRGNPPFGGDDFSHDEFFALQQEDGEWRIVDPPWPLYFCPEPTAVATPAAS
jgi:hypothetical protein